MVSDFSVQVMLKVRTYICLSLCCSCVKVHSKKKSPSPQTYCNRWILGTCKKKPKNGNHSWEIRISFECWTTGAKPTLGPNCRFRTTISPVKVCSRMNLVFFWLIEVCCNLWIFLGGWKHRIYTTNIYCMTLSIVSLTN